jgi:hypothetical protein
MALRVPIWNSDACWRAYSITLGFTPAPEIRASFSGMLTMRKHIPRSKKIKIP